MKASETGGEGSERPRVLFLCTHNSARSQMAEAFLRRHGGHRFEACSAGLEPTDVHPLTRRVLEELGINTADLRPKGINEFLGKVNVRYAIVMCEGANAQCPRIYPFASRTLFWPFEDPSEVGGSANEQLNIFRRVRDQIAHRVRQFVVEGA